MGRFYKSSKGNYLDFIYKQPTNLLLKAQQVADQSLAQQEQAYGDLYGRLQINALTPDDQRAKNILEGYEQRIEEKAVDLRNDPLKYINNPGEFRKLSNEIYKDKTRGQWASMEANTAARSAYKEKLQKMVDNYNPKTNVGISQKTMDELLANADARFANLKGTFGEAGDAAINTFSGQVVSDFVDVPGRANELMNNIKSNKFLLEGAGIKIETLGDGTYIFKDITTNESVSRTRVNRMMDDLLASDDLINNFYNTRQQAGIAGYSKEAIDAKKALIKDQMINKYAFDKIDPNITITAEEAGMAKSKAEAQIFNLDSRDNTVSTNYDGSVSNVEDVQSGTYDATINNTVAYQDDVISIKDRFQKEGTVIYDLYKKDIITKENYERLNANMNTAILTGDWTEVNKVLDAHPSIPLDLRNKIKNWTPAVATAYKNNVSKTMQGLNQFKSDLINYNKMLVDDPEFKDFNNMSPEEKLALINRKRPELKRFHNSFIVNGKLNTMFPDLASSSEYATRGDKMIAEEVEEMMDAIYNSRLDLEARNDYMWTDVSDRNKFKYTYHDAYTKSKDILGEATGYRTIDDNVIDEQIPTRLLPEWTKETRDDGTGNMVEDNQHTQAVTQHIQQKTHDKNGKLDQSKFDNMWSGTLGDAYKIDFLDDGHTEIGKTTNDPDSDALKKQFESKILVKVSEADKAFASDPDAQVQVDAVMNINGENVQMSVGKLRTRIQKVNGKYTTVYVQPITFTDRKGNQSRAQLVKPMEDIEVNGVKYGGKERRKAETEYAANNIISNTIKTLNKQSRITQSFAMDIEGSEIDISETIKIFDEKDPTLELEEITTTQPVKIIAVNDASGKPNFYYVNKNFTDHLAYNFNDPTDPNARRVMKEIKNQHSEIGSDDAPLTKEQAANVLEAVLLQ